MKYLIIFKLLLLCAVSLSYGQTINVASYNVRNNNSNDSTNGNGWRVRLPVISQMIQYHDFDVFGAQEVLHGQLEDILSSLPGYSHIGVGRNDGKKKGEYAPIFYKKDRFTLLDSGNFWLSENTSSPNKGWDAALPRICTWGEFRDDRSDKTFYVFNTHFDHVGVVARKESAKLILKMISKIAKQKLVVLMGDFNVDQRNESYALFIADKSLKDSYETAELRYAQNGTFNGFDLNSKTDGRIDHIFVTPSVRVVRYGILTDVYWSENKSEGSSNKYIIRTPSDHYPISTQLLLE